MRYAIKTSPQETTFDGMKALLQAADEVPLFESAWNFDHFSPTFSDPNGPRLEGSGTLTALTSATPVDTCGALEGIVDLAVVYVPPPHDANVVGVIADALTA